MCANEAGGIVPVTAVERDWSGAADAERMVELGWNQASVFSYNTQMRAFAEAGEGGYFVVCTQACSLVHQSLEREPHVELIAARPHDRLAPRSSEATGNNVRVFHLPVLGCDFPCVAVDITARFRIPREVLLAFKPDAIQVEDVHRRNFAAWLGRYYSRIALPDALVNRLRASLFERLSKVLKAKGGDGSPFHAGVQSAYIRHAPDRELGPDESYSVKIYFICQTSETADKLAYALVEAGFDPDNHVERDGLSILCIAQEAAATTLSDLDGYARLTEWDHLTGLGEAAELYG